MTSRAMRPLSLTVPPRLSVGDDGANVVFGCVGVEGILRSLEHAQQFALVGVEAFEELVRVAYPVRRLKMRSNRALSSAARSGPGASLNALS